MKKKFIFGAIFVCAQVLFLSCAKDSTVKNEVRNTELPEAYVAKSQEYNSLLVSLLDRIGSDTTTIDDEETLLKQAKKYTREFKLAQEQSSYRKIASNNTDPVALTFDQLNIIGKINKVSLTANITDSYTLNEILSNIKSIPESQRDLPYSYLAIATSASEDEIRALLGDNPELRLGNWETFFCNLSCAMIGGIHGAAIGICIGGVVGSAIGVVWGAVEGSIWSTVACSEPVTPLQPDQNNTYSSSDIDNLDVFLNDYKVYVVWTEDGSIDLNADINWVYPVVENASIHANSTQERDAFIRLQNNAIKSRAIATSSL